MLQLTFTYPFDPNGTAPSNLVSREVHTIAPDVGRVYNLIIPFSAPFFGASMQIKNVSTGVYLTKNIDYVCTHQFDAASNTDPFLPVYGSILLTNTGFTGQLELTYQTLGGEYTLSEQQLLTTLVNATLDPRVTTWESVAAKPYVYDPLNHTHHSGELVGMDDVVVAIEGVAEKLSTGEDAVAQAIAAHRQDENAHPQYATKTEVNALLETTLSVSHCGNANGSGNAIVLNQPTGVNIQDYSNGMFFTFEATGTNSATVTVAVGDLPAVPLLKNGNEALIPADIIAGRSYMLLYDQNSACFQLLNPSGTVSANATYARFVATAGQTVFKVPYIPGSAKVKRDGVEIQSFVATNGQTVVLNTGVPANTLIEINSEYEIGIWKTVLSGSTLIPKIQFIPDNLIAEASYKLPFNPKDGTTVSWIASTVGFETNRMVIVADDKPIMGPHMSLEVSTNGICADLIYSSVLGYWRVVAAGRSGVVN